MNIANKDGFRLGDEAHLIENEHGTIMDDKTIYQKYDELLASNTALSVENSVMAQRIDKLAMFLLLTADI